VKLYSARSLARFCQQKVKEHSATMNNTPTGVVRINSFARDMMQSMKVQVHNTIYEVMNE